MRKSVREELPRVSRLAQPPEQFQPLSTQVVLKHHKAGGVGARLRQTFDKARPNRVGNDDKHNGNGAGGFHNRLRSGAATGHKHVWGKCHEFRGILSYRSFSAFSPAWLEPHIAPWRPTQMLKRFQKCRVAFLSAWRVF